MRGGNCSSVVNFQALRATQTCPAKPEILKKMTREKETGYWRHAIHGPRRLRNFGLASNIVQWDGGRAHVNERAKVVAKLSRSDTKLSV
jgi:hypothetical protein